MNIGRLVIAIVAIFLASGLAKYGNENYEALKENGGVLIPILFLLGAVILAILGIRSLIKAFSSSANS